MPRAAGFAWGNVQNGGQRQLWQFSGSYLDRSEFEAVVGGQLHQCGQRVAPQRGREVCAHLNRSRMTPFLLQRVGQRLCPAGDKGLPSSFEPGDRLNPIGGIRALSPIQAVLAEKGEQGVGLVQVVPCPRTRAG
jgi:hypothetical protein